MVKTAKEVRRSEIQLAQKTQGPGQTNSRDKSSVTALEVEEAPFPEPQEMSD